MRRTLPALGCIMGLVVLAGPGCATIALWANGMPGDPPPLLEPLTCGIDDAGDPFVVALMGDGSRRLYREDDPGGERLDPDEPAPASTRPCLVVARAEHATAGDTCRRVAQDGSIEELRSRLTAEDLASCAVVSFSIRHKGESYAVFNERRSRRIVMDASRQSYTSGERGRVAGVVALTPLTAAVDLATLPIQLLVFPFLFLPYPFGF